MASLGHNESVLSVGRGLYLGRSALTLPKGALKAGKNFRVKEGRLENLNMGWTRFGAFTLNGPVRLIDNFFRRGQDEILIFGTLTDLYQYDAQNETVSFITPRYEVGTVTRVGTVVTGTGTEFLANVKVGDQFIKLAAGEVDPAAAWVTVTAVNSDTELEISAASAGTGSSDYTIRRLFLARLTDVWDTDVFVQAAGTDDLWFCTNGIDPVISWDGDADQVTLHPELGFTCRTLAVFSNMMIYGNVEQAGILLPTTIINSDVGDPLDVSSGLSEQFRAHGGTDEIYNLVPLGDTLVIYSSRTIVQMQFVGDPLVFLFRTAIGGLGPISPSVVADFGDFHTFVGSDAQYEFDGVTLNETNGHIWRDAIRTQDPIRLSLSFVHFDEENGDLIWSLPSAVDAGAGDDTTNAEFAFVEHYLEDVGDRDPAPYSYRDFPFTVSGYYEQQEGATWDTITEEWQDFNYRWNDKFFAAAFPLNLVGDIDGKIYTLSTSQSQDGGAVDSYVHFGRLTLNDGRMRALLTRLYPFATQFQTTLNCHVYMADHAAGPAVLKGTFAFDQTLPEGEHFVPVYRRGRFAEFRFGSNGINRPWLLEGFAWDVRMGGYR